MLGAWFLGLGYLGSRVSEFGACVFRASRLAQRFCIACDSVSFANRVGQYWLGLPVLSSGGLVGFLFGFLGAAVGSRRLTVSCVFASAPEQYSLREVDCRSPFTVWCVCVCVCFCT